MDIRRLARDERADLAAFLATLPPPQWEGPTLCSQWRVRDVVAHIISYDELDSRDLLAHDCSFLLRADFGLDSGHRGGHFDCRSSQDVWQRQAGAIWRSASMDGSGQIVARLGL